MNTNVMPPEGSEELRVLDASLVFDYFDPIIFNERNGKLVAGHVRVPRMIRLGFETADVVVVNYDEETHIARMQAANTHSGTTDQSKLAALITRLKRAGTDTALAMIKRNLAKQTILKEIKPKQPPQMAWTLVGVPIQEFSTVQKMLDALPPSAIVETSASDWQPDARKN
jgi:hypothetical protein